MGHPTTPADRRPQRPGARELAHDVFHGLVHDHSFHYAAGTAFRTMLAVFPLLLGIISLATLTGSAERVSDAATLEQIAAIFREGGWPAEVSGDALTAPYSAPSAGPPPWHLFRFTFDNVVGVATAEPNGATRWQFAR